MVDRYRLFIKNETITHALKNDKQLDAKGLEFERIYSLPSRHFSNSHDLIIALEDSTNKYEKSNFGMLAFLSAVMGLEAFVNSYFLFTATDECVEEIREIVQSKAGSLKDRTKKLLKASNLKLSKHQVIILVIDYVSERRHELVHPKPLESNVELIGSELRKLEKLHVPPWSQYNDKKTCLKLLNWCLFLPASFAASSSEDTRKFMLQWTGLPSYNPDSIIEQVSEEVRAAQRDGIIA